MQDEKCKLLYVFFSSSVLEVEVSQHDENATVILRLMPGRVFRSLLGGGEAASGED